MNPFISYPEPKLILCKDNARREKNEMNPFISYPEPKLILCKDNARRAQNKMKRRKTFIFLPSRSLSYLKIMQIPNIFAQAWQNLTNNEYFCRLEPNPASETYLDFRNRKKNITA